MNKRDTDRFKAKLNSEKSELESQLSGISERNPANPKEWDATPGGLEVDTADENEVADKMEELQKDTGIASKLEAQLTDVKDALDKIEKGTYGLCEKCGEPIKPERLEANPSARTCVAHASAKPE